MAQPSNRAGRDQRSDIEYLAADLYARRMASGGHGKTAEAIAVQSLSDARAFYRAINESKPASAKVEE